MKYQWTALFNWGVIFPTQAMLPEDFSFWCIIAHLYKFAAFYLTLRVLLILINVYILHRIITIKLHNILFNISVRLEEETVL